MNKKNFKKIGERLKTARELKQITLEEAGKKVDVHKSTILRWENGETEKIKLPILQILADLYAVNPSWLMGFDVPMKNSSTTEDNLKKLYEYMEKNNLSSIKLIPVFDNINLNIDWRNTPSGYTPFDAKIQNCLENNNYFYYKVNDNSMDIEKDTYILIEDTQDIKTNDIILYSIDNKNIELGIYKINLKQEKNFIVLGKYIK